MRRSLPTLCAEQYGSVKFVGAVHVRAPSCSGAERGSKEMAGSKESKESKESKDSKESKQAKETKESKRVWGLGFGVWDLGFRV